MKIQFSCSACGRRLAVDEAHAGKRAKCACGAGIVVPFADEPLGEGAEPLAETGSAEQDASGESESQPEPTAKSEPAAEKSSNKSSAKAKPALLPTGKSKKKKQEEKHDGLGDEPFARPHHELEEDLIDMTAMVDIVFFILIFFLVTSLQALQAAIDMPRTKPQEGATGKTVEQIEQAGEFIIVRIDADDKVWVNDSEAPTVQVVVSKLQTAKQGRGGRPGASKMLVLANSEARYGTIVSILDAGTHVGMDNVQLGGEDEEEAP